MSERDSKTNTLLIEILIGIIAETIVIILFLVKIFIPIIIGIIIFIVIILRVRKMSFLSLIELFFFLKNMKRLNPTFKKKKRKLGSLEHC